MRTNRLQIIFIILFTAVATCTAGEKKRMAKAALRHAATELHIQNVDSLMPGTVTYKIKERAVSVHANGNNELQHIGIQIFPKEMRMQNSSPVYDFIEFAALDHVFNVSKSHQALKSITFTAGNWDKLLAAASSDIACSINCSGKTYEVTWQKDGTTIARVTFPIQYDLLSLSNKEELEELFLHALRTTDGKATNHTLAVSSAPRFSEAYRHDNIKLLEGETHLKDFITSNLYYRKRGQKYMLFSQSMYPAESLADITLTADASLPSTIMSINFVKYDGTTEKVDVTVADWLAVMSHEGCQCYYGFDKQDGKTASIVLYASNPAKGYDHVLNLQCGIGQLDSKNVHITGTGYLFSPTTNVKNLFYKYTKKK